MLLDLNKIRGPVERVVRRYDPAAFDRNAESYRIVSPVVLGFDARKDGARYRLIGRLETAVELECSRCLDPFTVVLDTPFDLRYLPAAENAGKGEIEVDDDDLDAAFYRDERIDLGQLIREQIYLVLPMKPLCAEGCRGLCPECGTNRNTGACRCAPKPGDPRLAGLRVLLEPGDTPDRN